MALRMFIPAAPVPKGSAKAFKHYRTGRIIVTQDNRGKQKTFQSIATPVINQAMTERAQMQGAVSVQARFYVPRPKTVTRKLPSVKPDLDKFLRMILDALSPQRGKGGVWVDDGQVVSIVATKEYATADQPVGVDVMIQEVEA